MRRKVGGTVEEGRTDQLLPYKAGVRVKALSYRGGGESTPPPHSPPAPLLPTSAPRRPPPRSQRRHETLGNAP